MEKIILKDKKEFINFMKEHRKKSNDSSSPFVYYKLANLIHNNPLSTLTKNYHYRSIIRAVELYEQFILNSEEKYKQIQLYNMKNNLKK